jgi:hypothetical protein
MRTLLKPILTRAPFSKRIGLLVKLVIAVLPLSTVYAPAYADNDLAITLKHNSATEQETRTELQALMKSYDLKDYLFTDKIIIEDRAIPHSSPVLTLNTRHNGHPDQLLSAFVHEEIHWFVDAHEADELAAEKEYRQLFPKVPAGYPEGGEDEESTYLHLTVCYLEYQSMKKLVGAQRALVVMQYLATDHYTWVYKTILNDEPLIGAIVKRHHLLLRNASPTS